MQPYFYIVRDRTNGKLYAGSQYGKHADPSNLLKTYFTSCKAIHNRIADFDIVSVRPRSDARKYEARWLKRVYHKLGRDLFMESFYNRNIAPGILQTQEIIEKANVKRRVSNSLAAKKRIEAGTHNFQLNPHVRTEAECQAISNRMQGNQYAKLRTIDDDYRQLAASKARGNKNVAGKKWWTNGVVNRRSLECPGQEFYLGTTKKDNGSQER